MMTIGEFALHTGISVKALRFYDERRILPPAEVDPVTGYRFYAAGQLRAASTLRVLRTAGMSLDSCLLVLQEPDRAAELLARHQEQLQAERSVQDRAMRIGHEWLVEPGEPAEVRTRRAAATHWAAVSTTVRLEDENQADDPQWANQHFETLHTALSAAGNPPTGGWWTAIEGTDSPQEVEVLLSWPVGEPVAEEFTIEGLELRTGCLPERTEAFVQTELQEVDEDLLDDTPGGRLLHLKYLDFLEYLEENGHQSRHMRQSMVPGEDGGPEAMELAVTITP